MLMYSSRLVFLLVVSFLVSANIICFLYVIGFRLRSTLAIGGVFQIYFIYLLSVDIPISDIKHSDISSNYLWSITLQHPSYSLLRIIPYPKNNPRRLRLAVKLGAPYRGNAQLLAKINGDDFGAFLPVGAIPTFRYPEVEFETYEILFSSEKIDHSSPVSVIIHQNIPDNSLKISVWGNSNSSVYRSGSAWFGADNIWFKGVPHSLYGTLKEAFPIIWLESYE